MNHTYTLAIVLAVYLTTTLAISAFAARRANTLQEFVVAGRRLSIGFSVATIFATWFGAGTMLTAADEVRRRGLSAAALDPVGAGVCLLVAGAFYARPLYRLNLLTFPDFFERRFGRRSEWLGAALMVPSYFGWIGAQFVALAAVVEVYFGVPFQLALFGVFVFGTGYTLLGGMWSVVLTDAFQMVFIVVGLVVLSFTVLATLGGGDVVLGASTFIADVDEAKSRFFPSPLPKDVLAVVGIFLVGALGNLPGQDLLQRVFSARSANVASLALLIAGVLYLTIGFLPIFLALAVDLPIFAGLRSVHETATANGHTPSVLVVLSAMFMSPTTSIIFLLALVSAILSTIDSAILSPASVIVQNLLKRDRIGDANVHERLATNSVSSANGVRAVRISCFVVGLLSYVAALLGESAYSLLESAYELPLVSLFVPLTFGLFTRLGNERSALAAMVVGAATWAIHFVCDAESFLWFIVEGFPVSIGATLTSAFAYCGFAFVLERKTLSVSSY